MLWPFEQNINYMINLMSFNQNLVRSNQIKIKIKVQNSVKWIASSVHEHESICSFLLWLTSAGCF